jgi:hypothetical protein
MPRQAPIQQQLESAVPMIYHEMGQLFAYWVWFTQARPVLLSKFPQNSMQYGIMQNAAITASLIAVRKLNEFFKSRPANDNERDDDLRSYDYHGFAGVGSVIHPEDFREIHKRIAHMTYQEIDRGKVSYELYDAVGLVLPKCIAFLEHLRTTFFAGHEDKMKDMEIIQKGLIAMRFGWEREKIKAAQLAD